jgi:hypothetical protein
MSATSGSDIEDALDIINENGGTGEWEVADGEGAGETPRWLFPRFDGADTLGTCASEEEGHENVHVQNEECGETWVQDTGYMYLSRTGLGPYDTDVETLAAWLAAPRTLVGMILVVGEPGSGKTALIEAAACHAERPLLTHLCTPDDTRESLMLRFVGEGNGEGGAPFVKAALPRAAEIGAVFYGDEFMLLPDGVKPVFYELADGRRVLSGGNVDGSDLIVHPNFRLVVSSNPLVRGASLPEPIGSRAAGTTITVETSAAMLRDLAIDEAIVAAWESLGSNGLWRPQIREMRVADYWLSIDPAQAVSAFLPEHAPESQRKAIRDTVVSMIGGQTRDDGRLVVS